MALFRNIPVESYDREYTDRELVGRIAGYFAPWRRKLVTIVGMLLLRSGIGAVSPIFIAEGIDLMIERGDTRLLAILVAIVTGLGVAFWWSNFVQRRLSAQLIGDVVLTLRRDAFRSAMDLDMNFYDEYQSGRIVSRITSDSDEFGRVATLVADVISQLIIALLLLLILMRIELSLALLLLALAPAAFLTAFSFRRIARRITRRSQRAVAEVNVSIQEAVTGIGVAKNFRREEGIYDEFSEVNALSYDANLQRGLVLSMLFPTLNAVSGLGTALLLYYGGLSVIGGAIGAGSWFLFMNSVGQFWFPMINLSAFWSQFQAGLSATERIFALMDAEPLVAQRNDEPVSDLDGEIEFRNVDFAYSVREKVLEDFDLHIAAGESVALVGHTGAGKSSIAKLVTRFYEFQGGEILIDGHDIRTLDLEQYRRRLGVVTQVPFLFDGTVADNIRYGAPKISDEQVADVARRIGGNWIDALPNGLKSDVGERGARLSLGQRQLVVLARVLAQEPAIFILDEATASIDPLTEAQIQRALELIFRDRTSIVIAHRLSTIKAADRIIVLDHGKIIEEGTHESLMAAGGHYAELYNTYFRHQSLDYIEEGPTSAAAAD